MLISACADWVFVITGAVIASETLSVFAEIACMYCLALSLCSTLELELSAVALVTFGLQCFRYAAVLLPVCRYSSMNLMCFGVRNGMLAIASNMDINISVSAGFVKGFSVHLC